MAAHTFYTDFAAIPCHSTKKLHQQKDKTAKETLKRRKRRRARGLLVTILIRRLRIRQRMLLLQQKSVLYQVGYLSRDCLSLPQKAFIIETQDRANKR
eukprot:3605145-Amphidinium_carterae.2